MRSCQFLHTSRWHCTNWKNIWMHGGYKRIIPDSLVVNIPTVQPNCMGRKDVLWHICYCVCWPCCKRRCTRLWPSPDVMALMPYSMKRRCLPMLLWAVTAQQEGEKWHKAEALLLMFHARYTWDHDIIICNIPLWGNCVQLSTNKNCSLNKKSGLVDCVH